MVKGRSTRSKSTRIAASDRTRFPFYHRGVSRTSFLTHLCLHPRSSLPPRAAQPSALGASGLFPIPQGRYKGTTSGCHYAPGIQEPARRETHIMRSVGFTAGAVLVLALAANAQPPAIPGAPV